ncbi:hypothetical protein AVEN_81635-1 [Araneus ventricosus]|uniref:Uncharacterized protein n=1 Tax=Araneus ventricosus TaxID=182803 RepID=A0A4Y2HF50_ARAVE|nr:hypothetical protein AVEN_81635-1 [Araneus ventricosus]
MFRLCRSYLEVCLRCSQWMVKNACELLSTVVRVYPVHLDFCFPYNLGNKHMLLSCSIQPRSRMLFN